MTGGDGLGGVAGPGLTGLPPRDAHGALRKAAKQFEGIFLAQLFRTMRESVPDGGITERGSGEEMFTSMLDDRIADLAAQRSERGLGEALYRQLSRRLPAEASPEASAPEIPHARPGA